MKPSIRGWDASLVLPFLYMTNTSLVSGKTSNAAIEESGHRNSRTGEARRICCEIEDRYDIGLMRLPKYNFFPKTSTCRVCWHSTMWLFCHELAELTYNGRTYGGGATPHESVWYSPWNKFGDLPCGTFLVAYGEQVFVGLLVGEPLGTIEFYLQTNFSKGFINVYVPDSSNPSDYILKYWSHDPHWIPLS